MKISLALALAGSVSIAGALPATADGPASTPPAQHGTADDFTAKKDAYLSAAQRHMAAWGRKLDQYSRDAAAKGERAGKEADKELHRAWLETQATSRRLGRATEKGWDKAKTAFERASARLEQDWHRQTGQ
jgi:hypothetical protein